MTDHGDHVKCKDMRTGRGSQTGRTWRGQKGPQLGTGKRVSFRGLGLGLSLFLHGKGPEAAKTQPALWATPSTIPPMLGAQKKLAVE